jgi:hypothetical protein
MMEPADHREGDDLPPIRRLALAEFGGVLAEREVGPGSVIVLERPTAKHEHGVPNSHNFSHTPRTTRNKHATPENMIPRVFRGFLNDPDHSIYVGDLSLESGALDTSRAVGFLCDPEVGELDLASLAEEDV